MAKEPEEEKNYTTPILAAILVLLLIGTTVGYFVRKHIAANKPRRRPLVVLKSTPPEQKKLEAPRETKRVEIVKRQIALAPVPISQNKATGVKPALSGQSAPQAKLPSTMEKDTIYIKLSIYSSPPARIYIDHKRLVDAKGKDILTPVDNMLLKTGLHTIKLVAVKDPSRVWWVQNIFKENYLLYVDSEAGDW